VPIPLAREVYIVSRRESLSEILYARGIGRPGAAYRLYGKESFVELVGRLNPHLPDLARIPLGSRLVLVLPEELAEEGPLRLRVKIWADGQLYELRWLLYTVRRGDTISEILHRLGIGQDHGPFRLFGAGKGLARVLELNRAVLRDGGSLVPGQRLVVEVPVAIKAPQSIKSEPPAPPLTTTTPKSKVEDPQNQPVKAIITLPKEEIAKIPPEILGEKLTDEAIADLTPEENAKIPGPVREEKAWDFSLLDTLKPGASEFFSELKQATAAAYVGFRYGISIAEPESKLAAKLRLYSFLAEIRGGVLTGLRFYYDIVPMVSAEVDGQSQAIGWRRALLGWAFEFGPLAIIDKLHLTPKLGRYTVDSRLLLGENSAGEPVVGDLRIREGLSTGLEADVELAAFFYIVRLWAARDVSDLGIAKAPAETVSSTRLGLDLFLKGPGFGHFGGKASLHYLLFAYNEQVTLKGRHPDADHSVITLEIPFAGFGLSLAW
jgi:hypothetical protein